MKNTVFVAAAAMCVSVGAEVYTYNGGSSDSALFYRYAGGAEVDLSGSWSGGDVPFSAVTNAVAGASAEIVLSGGNERQFKNYRMAEDTDCGQASVAAKVSDWYFKSVSGDRNLRLEFPYVDYSYRHGRTFHIEDPSGFHGLWWQTARCHKGPYRPVMHVTSPDPAKAVVRRVLAEGRITFATDQGKTLTVEDPVGVGAFHVNTADEGMSGTVEILRSPGGLSDVTVLQGTLALHGNPDPDGGIVGDPYLHLDANVASSLTVSGDAVAEWRDVRGNGLKGVRHKNALGDPVLKTDPVSGLKVVSFGAFRGEVEGTSLKSPSEEDLAEHGAPSGLDFGRYNHHVKEIFVVFKYNQHADAWPALVGVTDSYADNPDGAVNRFQPNNTYCDALFKNEYTLGAYDERSSQNMPLNYGEIRLDGQRVLPAYRDDFAHGFHVLSAGLPADAESSFNTLCATRDAYWRHHVGGAQIGEVLVYTNALTSAQRRKVNAYLSAKWLKNHRDWDLGLVTLAGSSARVVALDGTVRIRELALPAGTASFVKTGAGSLVVDRMIVGNTVTNLPVTVEEGEFRLETGIGAVETVKAEDPDVWFDASQIAGEDRETIGDADYVTVWRDPRGRNAKGVAVTAARHPKNGVYAAYARILPEALNGKDVVSFGTADYLSASYDWATSGKDAAPYDILRDGVADPAVMPGYDTEPSCRVREGFMVCRVGDVVSSFFSTSVKDNYDFFNASARCPYAVGFGNAYVDGAYWQLDGRPYAAYSGAQVPAGRFVVLSFAAGANVPVDAIAMDRGGSGLFGGIDIAELLLYDRCLTAKERRDTTAYLMEKWLGSEHPDAGAGVGIFTKTDGTELWAGADGSVARIENPAGTLTKSGPGTVAVDEAMNFFGFSGFDVRSGTLSMSIGASNVMSRAYFHVDAEASDMVITNDVPGGTDYVTEWKDVRGNGRVAYAINDSKIVGGVSPTLRTMTIAGKDRKAVHFGKSCTGSSSKGSAMYWFSKTRYDDAARKRRYAEFYTVHADAEDSAGCLFGLPVQYDNNVEVDGVATSTPYPFMRWGTWVLHSGKDLTYATYRGEIYRDGSTIKGNTSIDAKEEFHLYSFTPLYPVYAGGFACREQHEWGGSITAEALVFEQTNSVVERAVLRGFLQAKWFGTEAGYVPRFDSVHVASGAELKVESDDGLAAWNVSALSGGGVVDTGHGVSEVETLTVPLPQMTGGTCLTVKGPLGFADGGRVTVEMPFVRAGQSVAGRYRIVAADGVTGEPLLTLSPALERGSAVLEKAADGLYLNVRGPGCVMLLR